MEFLSGTTHLYWASGFLSLSIVITVIMFRLINEKSAAARAILHETQSAVVFLFEDETLIDATGPARSMLSALNNDSGSDWAKFIRIFSPQFENFEQNLQQLWVNGTLHLTAKNDPERILHCELCEDFIRFAFETRQQATAPEQAAQAVMSDDLQMFHCISEVTPQMIWKQESDGTISWANRAYVNLVNEHTGIADDDIPSWPPARIFTDLKAGQTLVHEIYLPGSSETLKFEVIGTAGKQDSVIGFATDITAVRKAEETQKMFMQTMAQTFAHISTGLAIFDGNRKLKIFNPALHEFFGLPVDFLAKNPTFSTFLERLKERQMLPEPAEGYSWSNLVAELELKVQSGQYNEHWNLPTGQTLRVTGRPHPNGALALSFEDITVEVSVTRRFRREIEIGQNILNRLDEAVAIFTSAGTLTMCNEAYSTLWHDQEMPQLVVGRNLLEESRIWQNAAAPSKLWTRIREDIVNYRTLKDWSDVVSLTDGRSLTCRITPVKNDTTMVRFALNEQLRQAKPSPSKQPIHAHA